MFPEQDFETPQDEGVPGQQESNEPGYEEYDGNLEEGQRGDEPDYSDLDPLEERAVRLEEKARQQGWRPFEEWDGDPDDWVGAETFVVRGQLFDQQRQMKRQLREAQEVI